MRANRTESMNSKAEAENNKLTLRERFSKHPIAYGALASVALVGIPAAGAGVPLAIENNKAYWVNWDGDTSTIGTVEGEMEVQTVDVNLDELCLTAFTAEIKDAQARMEWEEGLLDKFRQVNGNGVVEASLCQGATTATVDPNPETKTYDIYIDSEDMYLKTSIDHAGIGEESDLPFSYSFSGSASTIPEGVLNSFVERTGIDKFMAPKALGMAMDARDSALMRTLLVDMQANVAEKCGPGIAKVTEADYKYKLTEVAASFVSPVLPDFEESWKKNVYIGNQSPENPDAPLEYSFTTDPKTMRAKLELNGGAKIEEGDVSECLLADDAKIVDEGGRTE